MTQQWIKTIVSAVRYVIPTSWIINVLPVCRCANNPCCCLVSIAVQTHAYVCPDNRAARFGPDWHQLGETWDFSRSVVCQFMVKVFDELGTRWRSGQATRLPCESSRVQVSSEPLLSTLQLKGTRYQTVHDIVRMLIHKRLITGSQTVYFPGSWDGFRLIPGLSG